MKPTKLISAIGLILTILTVGCAKHAAQAPVPGTINTFDAYAARAVGDAQAALVAAKTWEFCSDQNFPASVSFDNASYACDKTAGPFPSAGRPVLLKAEQSFNLALSASLAYHSGATSDTAGLTQALTQLGIDVGSMFTTTGKGK